MTNHLANPRLALDSASYVLPDGRILFSDLTEQFDRRFTGLVGRNGVGKSVLARLLAGELEPTTGRCTRSGTVCYLPQELPRDRHASVASLAGVRGLLDALDRIEDGGTDQADFDRIGDRWDIRQRLRTQLELTGLGHLEAETSAATLSGGEAMRVALIGACLSDADFLILDEPSNHLDRPNRRALIEQLQRWPKGLLVVSHDRQLLESMQRIVDLSSLGLQSYGGGYSFYAQCKANERDRAIQRLEQARLERKREAQFLREQRERLERRQARGTREGRDANQAKILLGRQKDRSETSSGKLRRLQEAQREQVSLRVTEAARQVESDMPVVMHALTSAQAAQRRVAELHDVVLPFVPSGARTINLALRGTQRIGVIGPNGCGKSTLLKLLAGHVSPLAGRCEVAARTMYLDQQLTDLDPARSALEHLASLRPAETDSALRTRLAQLGLDAQKLAVPVAVLSGGERLKTALACAIYAQPPADLLLLDEPSNHLDLASVEALEAMLRQYRGALLVVSHDDTFLARLGLTDRLLATSEGWRLEPL